jgi:hypothetical protein
MRSIQGKVNGNWPLLEIRSLGCEIDIYGDVMLNGKCTRIDKIGTFSHICSFANTEITRESAWVSVCQFPSFRIYFSSSITSPQT